MSHGHLRVLVGFLRYSDCHYFLKGIYRYGAQQDDWNLDTIHHDPAELQIQDICERGADGLLVGTNASVPGDFDYLRQYRGPIVSVTPDVPWEIAPHVRADHRPAYEQLLDHFQFLGMSNVAYLGLKCRAASQESAQRLGAMCASRGLPFFSLMQSSTPADELMIPPRTVGEIPPELREWLVSLPPRTGLLCRVDSTGCTVVRALQVLNRKVPEEIAVSGLGDDLVATMSRPPLTSYRFPQEEIGFQAAALLDRLMRGEPRPSEASFVSGGELVIRGSTQQLPRDIQQAMAIIRQESATGLTVKELCGRLSVSRVTLERRFCAALGLTPGEAIRQGRLEAARTLLLESDLTVEGVALRSGFESTSSFSKFFRERTGHSPGEYRSLNSHPAPQ